MYPASPCRRPSPWLAVLLLAAVLAPARADAQLRPLDPALWHAFDPGHSVTAQAGVGAYRRQRAAVAGTEGTLREVGNFQATWRSGRLALEIGGTVLRLFEDQTTFAPPVDGTSPEAGPRRRDSGDYHVATLVHLTPLERPAALALRFGTRLPTTNNRVGLERDRTDFFALLGGQYRRGGARLSAEAGVGIHGTRDPDIEQADVLVYAASAEFRRGWLVPLLALAGQKDGYDGWEMRGNEDLAELRAGVRLGNGYWVQALWVHGLTDFSPGSGVRLSAGVLR